MTQVTKKLTKKRSAQLITEHDIAPVGAPPTTLKDLPKDWEKICIDCGKSGASNVKIQVALGISDSAWYMLLKNSTEFDRVVKRTRQLSIVWWEDAGQEIAVTGKGNVTSWIFNVKNRDPKRWHDHNKIDHSSSDGTMSPAKEIKIEIVELKDGDVDDD